MRFHVELEGDLAEAWRDAMNEIVAGMRGAVETAINEAVRDVKASHRYTDRTGALTKSIDGRLTAMLAGVGAEGVIEATAQYASYIEEGTPPHVIRPKESRGFVGPLRQSQSRRKRGEGKKRSVLAWESPQGDWHFAAEVHHPGTRPYAFMGDAYKKAERVLERELELAVARAQQRLGR